GAHRARGIHDDDLRGVRAVAGAHGGGRVAGGYRHDRADLAPAGRQELVLEHVNGEGGTGHLSVSSAWSRVPAWPAGGKGASTAVMLSRPPASRANRVSACAAGSGLVSAPGRASPARSAASGW